MRRAFAVLRHAGFAWGKVIVGLLFGLAFLMLFTEIFSSTERESSVGVRSPGEHIENTFYLASSGIGAPGCRESAGRPAVSSQDRKSDSKLIAGDILLGRCELSPVPSLNPVDGWTHACMYIGDGRIMVATEPGVGVIKASLQSWMSPNMTWVCYLRVYSADGQTREKAVDYAESMRGLPYDMNWFSKQLDGDSWYCSELVWAAYLQASGGSIDLAQSPDLFGVSPDEIYASDHTVLVGGHYERKPDTILSLLMKVFALCVLAGGAGMAVEPVPCSRQQRRHHRP